MTGVAVARPLDVEERRLTLRVGADGNESHTDGIVHVVAAPEPGRAGGDGLEQIGQRGNGSVVQIWRPQPQSLEGHRYVSLGRPEVGELPRVSVTVGVVGGG